MNKKTTNIIRTIKKPNTHEISTTIKMGIKVEIIIKFSSKKLNF
jgi:hypothetical protein